MPLLSIRDLKFSWPGASAPTLDLPSLDLAAGESLFLGGPSGAGKSTLLATLSGVVDVPAKSVEIDGTDVGVLRGAARDRFRADHVGMIFQVFNLVPWLNAVENVLLPCRFSTVRRDRSGSDPIHTARALLSALKLDDASVLDKPASSLSVGQQQRVAAARALIGKPGLVLADEPTSALDEDAKESFVSLLQQECRDSGASLLFVSHDKSLAPLFDRSLDIRDINAGGATR
ncbi:ABC transporter ATP-binding protein [Shimia biformata]|uniref:ABC transporter ATP-binding protein n=1 Tax=Shimia biformata TaxID=1294299 RepID=UPI001952612F|nr:ABC transporter ATP-binding protein [Shimia biformata]